VLASGEGEVVTPPWRRLWWWIVPSDLALSGGMVVGVLIQRLLSA
jgi:hypothetical protein